MEQPFSKGGKAQQEGRPEEQWKRKMIYTCENAFPFVNKVRLYSKAWRIVFA